MRNIQNKSLFNLEITLSNKSRKSKVYITTKLLSVVNNRVYCQEYDFNLIFGSDLIEICVVTIVFFHCVGIDDFILYIEKERIAIYQN